MKEIINTDRKYPIGAEISKTGEVSFRVWASNRKDVKVVLQKKAVNDFETISTLTLTNEGKGYFSGTSKDAAEGIYYSFKLDRDPKLLPDPASRFQPFGPHGPSEIINPEFKWTDKDWNVSELKNHIIYEMHVGTFTREGTWKAAERELKSLAELGITLIEIMPVADFAGDFGWGYDGVNLYAPTRLYGPPQAFKSFVNTAHSLQIAVILDVVYNHFGPDGNYLKLFSPDYFTDKVKTDWGEAINFDGKNAKQVREFFITNAEYWIDEFHLDGLRLDATQDIHDSSPSHILAEITSAARNKSRGKKIIVVAENEPQNVTLVKSLADGGYGIDTMWNDDFHHSATVALTGVREAYYYDYRGMPQEFISAIKHGFLFQGQLYKWQKNRRGTSSFGFGPEKFITYIQNHDQVANSARGLRIHTLTHPGNYKAIAALNILSPNIPMIFQGQEFNASSPFLYFADHNVELGKLVTKGRAEFLSQFRRLITPEMQATLPDPCTKDTFEISKLRHHERVEHKEVYKMYRDLFTVRKELIKSGFQERGRVDGAVLSERCFVIRYFLDKNNYILVVNLGEDVNLDPVPEPLLAPPAGVEWKIKFSTENPDYNGGGTPPMETKEYWQILAHSAVLLSADT